MEIDDAERIGLGAAGETVTLFRTAVLRPGRPATVLGSLFDIDLDSEAGDTRVKDLDQDGDETLDFVDDGLPGPVSDDGILCGSGIPGDPLQDAQQTDFDTQQDALLAASGLTIPARSPIFCGTLAGVINGTGQTLPFLVAGGASGFGRRDFLWHGGRQLVLNFQRRNVFGFAVDFAEDRTKTSWGVEFSWMSNRLFANSNEFDGLSRSSELALSVSIDRPTFINFLNPSRSFFLNFGFFLRYIPRYHGGSDDRDGLYGTAESAFSVGNVSLTAITTYFQDKLSPRVTIVWDPTTSTYGVISGVGYRFNDSFSTAFGLNHFFGSFKQTRTALFPVTLLAGIGAVDLTAESGRGFAPARNRDVASMILRYTF